MKAKKTKATKKKAMKKKAGKRTKAKATRASKGRARPKQAPGNPVGSLVRNAAEAIQTVADNIRP